MEFKSLKKGTMIAALGLGLAFGGPLLSNVANAETPNAAAQQLVDALKSLGLNQVDYLYAYLQSVDLTDSEFNSIVANAEKASKLLLSVSSPEDLSDADRAQVARLFIESAQKAHLQLAFVDKDGNAIDLKNLSIEDAKSLVILIKDLKGNTLASIDPKMADFTAAALTSKLEALTTAVEAKKELEKDGSFVPMPNSPLPNTGSSDLPLGMALGGLLVVLGGIAFVPAMRAARRMENQA